MNRAVHDEKTIARFMAKVAQPAHGSACWFWTGAVFKWNGYGAFRIGRRTRLAHRVAWEIGNRAPFPDGLLATHSCDNKRCVNFDHIRPGTKSSNGQEAWDRGKVSKQAAVPNHESLLCKRGLHKLSEAGYTRPNGKSRYCFKCKQETQAKWHQRRRR